MKKSISICLLIMGVFLAMGAHAEKSKSAQITLESVPNEMKQFSFLIGKWDLKSQRFSPDGTLTGQYDGTWEGQYLDEGRIILDLVTWFNSDGTKESFFPTLRTFSPKTNQWEMTYMSSQNYAHPESFRGKFVDGEGHFDVVVSLTPEQSALGKVRFYNITKKSLDWSMKLSLDNGKTWFVAEQITGKRVH